MQHEIEKGGKVFNGQHKLCLLAMKFPTILFKLKHKANHLKTCNNFVNMNDNKIILDND